MVMYSNIRSSVNSFTKRFLTDADQSGTKIDVNVNSRNFTVHADRKPNGKTSGNIKLRDITTIAGKTYNVSTTLKTGEVQEIQLGTKLTPELEMRIGAVAKRPVINAEGRVTDNAGASLGFTYQTAKMGLSTDVKYIHQKDVQMDLNAAAVYRNFIFGGKTRFNVQEQDFQAAIKNLEVGARGDFGDYSTYMTMSDEFKGVKGGVEYRIPDRKFDAVFAESEYIVNKADSVKLAVGVQRALASGATTAIRLTNDFQIGASYKTRVNPNLVATVAANVDTNNANTSKVGLNLDFQF